MEGIATTKDQANSQLERIRKRRTVNEQELSSSGENVNISDLHEALNIISDQLYKTPTHFLLELIQNADDNTYADGIKPSMRIVLYEKGDRQYLRTDCNEIGFNFEQLKALMRVGCSTKKRQNGYIGEKGIGFKSVFKVTDVVKIASGFYEFKLDRNQPVGMVQPIVSRFPRAHRVQDNTQFLLRLKTEQDYDQILRDLEDIEPQLLMFLRRLKKLRISTPMTDKIYRARFETDDDDFEGETVTISERFVGCGSAEQKAKYIVQRHKISNLPPDSRREGITKSEVVLAFPFKKRNTPITEAQKVFAFLPIDTFCFPFLIHADFLLVASREAIEYRCQWNLALRDGIQEAFMEAIDRLIRLPEDEEGQGLCYTWPMYLPRLRTFDPFWDLLREGILSELRGAHVLKSRDEDTGFRQPHAVGYVPEKFRLGNDTLFNTPSIRRSQLAFDYDVVKDQLELLGVQTMGIRYLFDEFSHWLGTVGVEGLNTQSVSWHRKVATLFSNQYHLKEELARLPIIPLRDGSWVNARADHVYLAPEDEDEHVPTGVAISIVDEAASQDSQRRHFLKFLGIEKYAPRQVCDLILELHAKGTRGLSNRDDDDLIDDLEYLFHHRSLLEEDRVPKMLFIAQKDGVSLRTKSRIYIINTDPEAKPGLKLVEKYRNTAGNPFSVLDDRYEAKICAGGDRTTRTFHKWLLASTNSCFATAPVLVRHDDTGDSKLTSEWTFLCDSNVTDLLLAVQSNLKDHSQTRKLLKAVPKLKMRCRDGNTRRLGGLALPTTELLRECPHLDFADLPNPTKKAWGFLSAFKVITTCGTTARLRELEALASLPPNEVNVEAVHNIYRALDSSQSLGEDEIRDAFKSSPLVLITQPDSEWITHRSRECVWTAPALLTRVKRLNPCYKDCKRLFHDILQIQPAGIQHVVGEFCSLSKGSCENATQRCAGLLSLLKSFFTNRSLLSDEHTETRLKAARAFPVVQVGDSPDADPKIVLRSLDDGNWYIPDSTTLELAFRRKLDLLHLPVKQVQPLRSLFEKLGCKGMLLSNAVTETIKPHGMCIRDKQKERDLQVRLRYIACLRPAGDAGVLPSIRVWSVSSITITRQVNGIETSGHDELVMFREKRDTMDIYFREIIPESDQSKVTLKLAQYFSGQSQIDGVENLNRLNFLLSAPTNQLPDFMESQNIFLPDEGSDGGDGSSTHIVEADAEAPQWGERNEDSEDSSESGDSDANEPSDLQLRAAFKLMSRRKRRDESFVMTLASNEDPRSESLQELIPSHQSMVESIIQGAANFEISDSVVARAPARHELRGTRDGFGRSLPILTRNSHVDSNRGYSAARQQTSASTSHERHGHEGIWDEFVGDPNSSSDLLQQSANYIPLGAGGNTRPVPVRELRFREIGFLGEVFIHRLLADRINDWTFENWTSKMRVEDGHPRFTQLEGEFADFTYLDDSLQMSDLLREAGVEVDARWSRTTTYHLEVKGTLGRCGDPFFVSQNQVDLMRRYHDDPDNVYILLRVFDIRDGSGGIKMFPNPWSLFVSGVLNFRSKNGYVVFGGDASDEIS